MANFVAKKHSLRGRKGTVITVHGNDVDTLHRLGVIDKGEKTLSPKQAPGNGAAQHQPKPTSTSKAQSKGNANAAAEADELLKLASAQ